jgi:hypothetical protein
MIKERRWTHYIISIIHTIGNGMLLSISQPHTHVLATTIMLLSVGSIHTIIVGGDGIKAKPKLL